MSFPGRYSRWDIASLRPAARNRSAWTGWWKIRPLNLRGQMIVQMLYPLLAGHPHWGEFRGLRDGALVGPPEAAAGPVFRRRSAASSRPRFPFCARSSRSFRNPADHALALVGRLRATTCCSSSSPSKKRLPRHGHKDLHLYLCDDIYFMDRKKEQIERYQYDFDCEDLSTLALDRGAAEVAPAPVLPARPHRERPHARGVHGQCGDRAARYEAGRLLRSGAAADLPHALRGPRLGAVRARAARQPQPLRVFSCNSATSSLWAPPPKCSCASKAAVCGKPAPISGTAQRTGDPHARPPIISATCCPPPRRNPS